MLDFLAFSAFLLLTAARNRRDALNIVEVGM